jgi:hypothetical protein
MEEGAEQQINAQDHGVFVQNLLGSSNLLADSPRLLMQQAFAFCQARCVCALE